MREFEDAMAASGLFEAGNILSVFGGIGAGFALVVFGDFEIIQGENNNEAYFSTHDRASVMHFGYSRPANRRNFHDRL